MRALAVLCGPALLVMGLGCTTEDAIPAYVSIEYQLRCLDSCRNALDNASRHIYHVDGEDGLDIRCEVGTRKDGERLLSFSAFCPGNARCGDDRYGIEVEGLNVARPDGGVGDGCQVRVTERQNTYESPCTTDELNATNRCRLTLDVDEDRSEVTGTLRCADIADPNAPSLTRHLVRPGGSATAEADFVAEGCQGL